MTDAHTTEIDTLDALAILSPKRARELCGGLSPATLWRMRQRGDFPSPVQVSPGRVGFRRADLIAWLQSRQTEGAQVAR